MALVVVAALVLFVFAERADGSNVQCCYQLSVQAGGTEVSNNGDGTGTHTFFRGKYSVHWQFAYRALEKFVPSKSKFFPLTPHYRFTVDGHPEVFHNWTVDWAFHDTPQNVEAASPGSPSGWAPACAVQNADIGSNGFVENADPSPVVRRGAKHLFVAISPPARRADFQCGLEDGRLAGVLPGPFDDIGELTSPEAQRFRNDKDFAQTCSQSASFGPNSIRFVKSTGSVQVRARFKYFPRDQLYDTAKRLESLAGTDPPGFNGPPSTPNKPANCRAG